MSEVPGAGSDSGLVGAPLPAEWVEPVSVLKAELGSISPLLDWEIDSYRPEDSEGKEADRIVIIGSVEVKGEKLEVTQWMNLLMFEQDFYQTPDFPDGLSDAMAILLGEQMMRRKRLKKK